jgi:AAA ATPase domain
MSKPFINRNDEINTVLSGLTGLEGAETLQHRIILFYGPPGIGKTALFKQIPSVARKWRHGAYSREQADSHPLVIPRITIPNDSRANSGFVLLRLFNTLRKRKVSRALEYQRDRMEQVDPLEFTDTFVRLLSEYINTFLTESARLILLIDQYELLKDDAHTTLLTLFRRLLPVPGWISVIFCTYPRDFADLSARVAAHELPLFSFHDSLRQLGLKSETALASEMIGLTGGLPAANEVATPFLRSPSKFDSFLSPSERITLVDKLYRGVIKGRVLQYVQKGKKKRFETILKLLSVPRSFNISSMRTLIEEFASDGEASGDQYLHLIEQLTTETNIIDMHDFQYEVREPFRGILSAKWEEEDPEGFSKAHAMLGEKYEELIGLMVKADARLLYPMVIEYLYNTGAEGHYPVLERYQGLMSLIQRKSADQFPYLVSLVNTKLRSDQELRTKLGSRQEELLRVNADFSMKS